MKFVRQYAQNFTQNFYNFVELFVGIFSKKSLQKWQKYCIIANVVTLEQTMKREVAAESAGFSVENVRFRKPGGSHAVKCNICALLRSPV